MPHDCDGKELKVGDLVYVPAKIKTIELTEHYCNVTLETSLSICDWIVRVPHARAIVDTDAALRATVKHWVVKELKVML